MTTSDREHVDIERLGVEATLGIPPGSPRSELTGTPAEWASWWRIRREVEAFASVGPRGWHVEIPHD